MLRSYTLLGLALALIMSFSGCKKDEDNPSRRAMLTAGNGTWKLTALTVDPALPGPGGTTVSNIYAQFNDCTKDDVSIFLSTNNTYREEEGATKCSQTDPQIIRTGTWTLSSDEKNLNITAGGTATEIAITSMSGSELKGTFRETDAGITFTYSGTWTKQ